MIVLFSIILGLVLLFNVYNFISLKVLHKDLASLNGYAMLEVVSGSMEPTIHVGDIIIINTKKNNYKENDIITFKGKEGEFVTHRIIDIEDNRIVTQGDNNDTEDEPIKIEDIVGKYITKINGGGKLLSSFKSPFTMAMIFIIGLLACVLFSTDKDGNPILDQDEAEFQEFLKNKDKSNSDTKNEKKEEGNKKVSSPKKSSSSKPRTKKLEATKNKIEEKKEIKKTPVKKTVPQKTVKKTTTKTSNKKTTKTTTKKKINK